MLTYVRLFSFLKYVFTKRLFFMRVRSTHVFMPALSFLCSFGFVTLVKHLYSVLVIVMSFTARSIINHIRLFLRRTNRVLIKPSLIRRLFFLSPSGLWLTVIAQKPKPVLLHQLGTTHVSIFGFLS
uniref:hypothetical protein n=1 Tax=Euplotes vannus TaxID=5939 RepID=UPI002E76F9A6|nr:hypothetical protein V3A05_mgp14 [Euplotes vannus]UPM52114.1 hypothetical protein [Euplotes vannus]